MSTHEQPERVIDTFDTRFGSRNALVAPAIEMGNRVCNQSQLRQAVCTLSTRLVEDGVGPEVVVGLCSPRSIGRIIAMLAIWRAGGVVLALDPAWPDERLLSIVNDAGASCVLGGTHLGFDDLSLQLEYEVQMQSSEKPVTPAAGVSSFLLNRSDDLAYIVYTSGSSGSPKGVEITHGNLRTLAEWHVEQFAISGADRVSHLAGLGFDAAFWETWPALSVGATVVLPENGAHASAPLLQRWLIEQRISVAFVPTVLAELLFTLDWPETTSLRVLLTGGEALKRSPPVGLPFKVINNYGPSECTVVATSGQVVPGKTDGVPTIGRELPCVRIHLLNPKGALVLEGTAGEIHIGGATVGRGYRNAPDLTRALFVADPFSTDPAARLYRSGDLARRLADGRLMFLGRIDDQEQLRGVRVEPGEVARGIERHPDVRWCTVLGADGALGRELHAYILTEQDASLSAEQMADFLAGFVPEAMVPSKFFTVDKVPLNINGKLDRHALLLAGTGRALPRSAFRAPEGPVELRIAAIIGKLFSDRIIGATDNFFFIGGHSLVGAQAVTRIRENFGVALSLRDLFAAPTVRQLAGVVTGLLVEKVACMSDEEAEVWLAD